MICYDVHLAFINRRDSANGRIISDNERLVHCCAKLTLRQVNFIRETPSYAAVNDYSIFIHAIIFICACVDIAYFAARLE